MTVVEKINLILKKANISKVNLSKYLGVSRQMVYNYLDGDDLEKIPNEKCQLLFELLDVDSKEEILELNVNNDYIQKIGSKIFNFKKEDNNTSGEVIDVNGLSKEEIQLVNDIVLMIKNILLEGKSREVGIYTIEYLYNFIQNLASTKELKYILGYFSKNFGYTDPNKYVFDENNQFILESIMFSAMTLYTNGGASRTRLSESHKRWETALMTKKEEKLSRTQELNTAKLQALRELGYDKIDEKNASVVLDKIAEIMTQKF